MNSRELLRKAELAELLLHAARQLGESIEPERIYARFHELVADVIQHDGVIISSYDDRDELIRCEYAWSDGAVLDAATLPALPLNREGGGMQSRVIVSGEPLLFNDVPKRVTNVAGVYYNVGAEGKLERIPDSGPSKTSAAMMVPVKDEGRVVGVVQLMTDRGEYTQDELELFDGLVAQMGAAVRNARLQQERRRLEAAEAAARAVAAEREQAAQVLEAVGDGIFLLDGAGRSASGIGPPLSQPVWRPKTSWAGVWSRSFRAGSSLAPASRSPRKVRWRDPSRFRSRSEGAISGSRSLPFVAPTVSSTPSATSRPSGCWRRREATSSPRSRTNYGRR